jgi:hypothetical protein
MSNWIEQLQARVVALYRANPMLIGLALIHLFLVPLELSIWAFDSRTIGGESVWLKPLRFDTSIAIYLITMTFVLGWMSASFRKHYSLRIAIAMIIETLCIGLQAARGVPSHFNIATPLNGIVFNLMGLAIFYHTYLLVRILIDFWRGQRTSLADLMRRAVVLGLGATLAGSVIGGLMAARLSHVGLHGGDLRLGHFIGLHGLQLMLLLGVWLSQSSLSLPARRMMLHGAFFAHLALTFATSIGA